MWVLREEESHPADRHDVRQDRAPHVRRKMAAGVEHVAQEDIETVEEDLRHADQRESGAQRPYVRGPRRGAVEPDQQPCAQRADDSDDRDGGDRQREQTVDVLAPTVGMAGGARDLRDQDCVDDTAGK